MHPVLSGGNNYAAKVSFQRNILQCTRLKGPKSAGTGVWTITDHGMDVLQSTEIEAAEFPDFLG